MLDPFCGCAITCVSAESLARQWIGIDEEVVGAAGTSAPFERDWPGGAKAPPQPLRGPGDTWIERLWW